MVTFNTQMAGTTPPFKVLAANSQMNAVESVADGCYAASVFGSETINLKDVVSVDKTCNFMIKDVGSDQKKISISYPDLDCIDHNSYTVNTYWGYSTPNTITMVLSGHWSLESVSPNVTLTLNASTTIIQFTNNKDGLTQSIDVKKYYDFDPIADAYVRNGTSTKNFGADSTLLVKDFADSYIRKTHVKFDVGTSIPNILTAKVRLYASALTNGTSIPIRVNGTIDSWTEAGINWSNAPAGIAISTITVDGVGQYYEWDVTSYVQNQLNAGDNIISLVFDAPSVSAVLATFCSKESNSTSRDPQLIIRKDWPKSIKLTSTLENSILCVNNEKSTCITVYPNPVTDIINIFINTDVNDAQYTITLFDFSGKMVYKKIISDKNLNISTEGFPKGMYLLKISTISNDFTQKVIVK